MDSSRALSPSPKANGGGGAMDYVYLKTILLQFLEQKDRKVQADLVRTVLGQLLHFDKYVPFPHSHYDCAPNDETFLLTAITERIRTNGLRLLALSEEDLESNGVTKEGCMI